MSPLVFPGKEAQQDETALPGALADKLALSIKFRLSLTEN
jgi:hypothetical protein